MSRRLSLVTLVAMLALALALAACGGDDTAEEAPVTTAPPNEESEQEPAEEPADDASEDSADGTATESPATTVPESDGAVTFTEAAGVPLLETSTPTSDLGARPLLEWQPVDGAAFYRVIVQADGAAYWAWTGGASSVAFGGSSLDGPQGQTAQLTDAHGYSWTVSAWSADDELLAMSTPSALAP